MLYIVSFILLFLYVLAKAGIVSLKTRYMIKDACVNFVKRVSPDNPSFCLIQSRIVHSSSAYCTCSN